MDAQSIILRVFFDWDSEKAAANERKHNVSFEEAREVFDDPRAFHFYDDAHSVGEIRYNVVGAARGRLLFVVYTQRGPDLARLISARVAGKFHRKLYEQQAY